MVGRCRWGTREKLNAIESYSKGYYQYVGIAYDEIRRIAREKILGKLMPLVDFKMTEKDCLEYCYSKGFNWIEDGVELYSILDRVSCWCCCNKNLKELKNYYIHLPNYWNKLKDLQSKTFRPMKYNKYSVYDLENRFKVEINGRKILPKTSEDDPEIYTDIIHCYNQDIVKERLEKIIKEV